MIEHQTAASSRYAHGVARLAWLTDIHLDFVEDDAIRAFGERIAAEKADVVLVTGDLSVAPTLVRDMKLLADGLGQTLRFVLGNHDFYGSDIASVHQLVTALTASDPRFEWLGIMEALPLGEHSALIGIDGWGDARLGNADTTPVLLNDFIRITDLISSDRDELLAKLRALGDAEASRARPRLARALERYWHVVVATHVPPFAEACWHAASTANADWLPWFTCKAVGDVLLEAAQAHTSARITVLCGHTHGAGSTQILDNLEVHTGAAEYGRPSIQALLDFD